uniref:Helicase C-terminal domain-containing protein n=1 Tax=Meloidogyne incognita TaxID=6306 RepID=A0A914KSY3_MELIC
MSIYERFLIKQITRLFVRSLLKVQLENDNYNCLLFHADVSGSRDHILDDFKSGKIRLLIASDALARGIDVEDVTHVINYDTPEAQQNYQHRVGRTARMGREGYLILST